MGTENALAFAAKLSNIREEDKVGCFAVHEMLNALQFHSSEIERHVFKMASTR